MVKKWLSALLAAVLALGLTACTALLFVEGGETPAPTAEQTASLPAPAGPETPNPAPPDEMPASTPDGASAVPAPSPEADAPEETLDEDGVYTSREEVALYIHLYGRLPGNFLTKGEARALGWPGGSLEPYAPGMCIGGDRFGNREGLLPEQPGRTYTECDIDTLGADQRGARRIVFSNDGLIYYTEDHYQTFELLYGEE